MICLYCDTKVRLNLTSYDEHIKTDHGIIKCRELILTLCFLNEFEREDLVEQFIPRLENFKLNNKVKIQKSETVVKTQEPNRESQPNEKVDAVEPKLDQKEKDVFLLRL